MKAAFEALARIVKAAAGIVIEPDKLFVLESRLLPLARQRGYDTVAAFVDALVDTRDPAAVEDVVDALSTKETFFFRDRAPFELFASTVLPYLVSARERERAIRIWCTACSTGQEPYSLAMTIDEAAPRLTGWRIDLQASDVSKSAVRAAREGYYNQFEVQRGLPASVLLRYFSREGERWRIAEHMRARVHFSIFNLLRSFDERGPQDVIFCRNVLIYFDQRTKKDVLARLAGALRPDGFLVLGSTETITRGEGWAASAASPMLYVRADGPHVAMAETAGASAS